ncbi:MAG TPA: hypothetical protein DDW42_05945 [Desulfobacteraceae bacterium]|nr:hypothetical protein [Desulfobacteraceae bacterium]
MNRYNKSGGILFGYFFQAFSKSAEKCGQIFEFLQGRSFVMSKNEKRYSNHKIINDQGEKSCQMRNH